jgi:hypothetical protein
MENNSTNITTDNQGVKTDTAQGSDNPSVETGNDNKTVENAVPYPRFNEVISQNKELKSQIKKFQEDQENARLKALEEEGKFKELNSELSTENKSLKEKLETYYKKELEVREGLLAQLDENDKEVYGTLNNEQLRKHLSKKNITSATTNTSPQTKVRENVDRSQFWNMSKEEQKTKWKDMFSSYKNKK